MKVDLGVKYDGQVAIAFSTTSETMGVIVNRHDARQVATILADAMGRVFHHGGGELYLMQAALNGLGDQLTECERERAQSIVDSLTERLERYRETKQPVEQPTSEIPKLVAGFGG